LSEIVFVNDNRVTFKGACSREEASALHQALVCRLKELVGQKFETVELDLRQVEHIDACGCQLLALFLEHLRRHGIMPTACLGPEVAAQISLLGFSETFSALTTL
jgi:anti-anti-sigma regulatory factor